MKKALKLVLGIFLFFGCSNNTSKKDISENNDDVVVVSSIDGRVVDGEISGATVFLDINKNGLLDENETSTTTDKKGFFSLKVKEEEIKDYTVPLVAFGGKDIRLNSDFEEILISFRDKNLKSVNISPVSTLIANDILSQIDDESSSFNSKLQKISSEELFKLLEESKKSFAELFELQESIITADPIQLALNGDLSLLKTNIKVNKVAREIKKSIKKELRDKKKDALSSYRALSKALRTAQREARKGDEALTQAIDYIEIAIPALFDSNLIPSVKAVTKYTLEVFENNWEENKNDILNALEEERAFVGLQETDAEIEKQISEYDSDGDGLPDNPEDISTDDTTGGAEETQGGEEVYTDNPDNNNTEDGLNTITDTTGDDNIPTTDGEDSNVIKLKVGEPFSKEYNLTAEYTLVDAPKGMRILENGYLTWTPSKSQIKDYNITILNGGVNFDEINISVEDDGLLDINGYFVDLSLSSSTDENGSEDAPFSTIEKACDVVQAGENLYIRGGIYHSSDYLDGNLDKYAFVKVVGCNGENGANITIRPWGNELVKILSDGYAGISVFDSSYVTIDGLEVEGIAQKISLPEAVTNWWIGARYYDGGGIAMYSSSTGTTHNISVQNCVVHDVPGTGIKSYGATHINIENNIVYNTNWWTIQGTTGVGIVLAPELDNDVEGEIYNKITGNIIFDTEQRIFSRVWTKSGANFVIDEGEAILIQEGMISTDDEDGSERTGYAGRYLVENNIMAYNSMGVVINLADKVNIYNNTLYNNGTTDISPYNGRSIAGISLNTSDDTILIKNIVKAKVNGTTYWLNQDSTNIQKSDNHFSGYFLEYDFINYDGIVKHDVNETLLKNPEMGDFTPIDELNGIGSNTDILKKVNLFGINILPTNYEVNQTLLVKLILDAKPSDIGVTGYEEDDNNGYLHIQFPDDHPHTTLTGDNNYTLEIPLSYLEDINISEYLDLNITSTTDENSSAEIVPLISTDEVLYYKSKGLNLLTNGSFELGIGTEPYYIGWSPEDASKGMNPPPLPIIDDTTAMYGNKSIKFTLPNKDNFFIIDFKPPYIADSGDYDIYMGVSAKTDCPNDVMLNLYTNADARIAEEEWNRYRFRVQTSRPAYPIYKFRLINLTDDNRSCNIWLDGFTWSLEENTTENFVRSDTIEAVFVSKPNRISMHFDNEDVLLEANIDANETLDVVAELHVRDLTRNGVDKVYLQKDLNLTDENTTTTIDINLGQMKHGAYMAHLVLIDANTKEILGEAREKFSVMSDLTKIEPPVDFIVGIHGGFNTFSPDRTFDYRGYWNLDEYYQEAYQIGIRAQRIIVGIPEIMPDGDIDFSLEAPAIDKASENNCTTVLAINPFLDVDKDYSPSGDNVGDWVVTDENQLLDGVNDYKDLYRLPEDKLVDLYEYVGNRFNGKLLAIENENELNMFYTAEGMAYAVRDLFEPIYEPFKNIAPDIPILVDITMDFYGIEFTKHFFENNGTLYADGVTYHPYAREWIYRVDENGNENYGINFIQRNEDYINADYNSSKKLIMGMTEIHEVGILSTVGWEAMQRILLDWSGGAKFSAGILGEGLYFLEARDRNEWREKSPHAPGIGAVAINGMYSILGGYQLYKRIDMEETNSKILIIGFENNQSEGYKYAIAIAQGDVPNQIANVNVELPTDTVYYDQWGAKLEDVALPLKLSNEILYIKSDDISLIQAFEDINASEDVVWVDEPNGYDYVPELVDFKTRPEDTWFHELVNTGIRPRTKRE